MDILDILIAKKQSFTAETERLVRQAKKAMNDANEVVAQVSEIEDAATTAAEQVTSAAEEFDAMKADITAAAAELVDDAIDEKLQDFALDAVNTVNVENNNTSAAKVKQLQVTKNNATQSYNVEKNYTSTGQNEDGSMTQKAITNALSAQKTELENKIKNIKPSGGGGGNISGNISPSDYGAIIAVDENGNIIPSSITEVDIVLTQIITGTYKNPDIVGLEIDYNNKSFTRLQGAKDLTPGADFDKFTMYGGRKRCIVNQNGSILRFVTEEDTPETLADKRIMVYQPAFYYLRIPMSITKTANGFKINKEHIYLSDKRSAGFTLHPIFRDADGNALRYILIPAFESGTYHVATNTYNLTDEQDVDLQNDYLVSVINAKPIGGLTQEFTIPAAKTMANNNGAGWDITNLEFESMNQMLMLVEYGSLNLQNAFDPGISTLPVINRTNYCCTTGSTLTLGNASGRAESTSATYDNNTYTYTTAGKCAISYRGMENPYGNTWRFIGDVSVVNNVVTHKDQIIDFKLPATESWISAFGYDANNSWVFLPIEASSAGNSSLPIGDYFYRSINTTTEYGLIVGGNGSANINGGPFNYAANIEKNTFHQQHDSARVMFIPTVNTSIDNNNYNIWYDSLS